MDGEEGSSERCLKWGGVGGEGVINGSFQKHLKGKSGQKISQAQMKEREKCKTTSHH